MPATLQPPSFESVSTVFQTLSDPTRLRILSVLAGGERCVADLCDAAGLPQPTVSTHLARLRTAGLVERRRDGKRILYRLGDAVGAGTGGGVRIRARGVDVAFEAVA